jgi:hypothetical protein
MNTNLELTKDLASRQCVYMTDTGSAVLIHGELEPANQTIFDNLVNALKTEFSNKTLAKPIINTSANLDILFAVDDADIDAEDFDTDVTDFAAMTQPTQDAMTAFINMANSL